MKSKIVLAIAGLVLVSASATYYQLKSSPPPLQSTVTPTPKPETSPDFGYIKEAYAEEGNFYLTFDPAIWFSDDDPNMYASDAAAEDGLIGPGEIMPNGYYIRNKDTSTQTLWVSPYAQVHLQLDPPLPPLSIREFIEIYQSPNDPRHWITTAPYRLENSDNQVTTITQQYIP